MSRIGRNPIVVPDNVTIDMKGEVVAVTGPNGTMERTLPEGITVAREGSTLVVDRADDERDHRALHGLTRTLLANMVTGVTTGWSKELEIQGVGYRAAAKGPGSLELALGFSHPVIVEPPAGITFVVEGPRVHVQGTDKEHVGQVAANIRKLRPPEPYKGKGIRYSGERVRRKAGKSGKVGK